MPLELMGKVKDVHILGRLKAWRQVLNIRYEMDIQICKETKLSLIDGRAHHHANIFPHSASSVVYSPTLLHDYIQKLSDTDNKSPNSPTKMTMILRKGYTSDEDLDDLDDPFASIGRTSSSPAIAGDGILQKHISASNFRFDLLRKVWCECD